jgi:hypothetical protein
MNKKAIFIKIHHEAGTVIDEFTYIIIILILT